MPSLTLVQAQEIGNLTGDASPLVESISTSNSNMLAVWVGSVLSNATTAELPAFSVSDSASNMWYPVALTSASNPAARGMWWVCPNALPVSWVSVAPTGYFSNVVGVVCEFSGLPSNYYPVIDTPGTAYTLSGTSLGATMTCAQADFTFSLFVAQTGAAGTVTPPAGMTSVTGSPWEQGSTINQVTVAAAYGTASAGSLTTTWSMTGSATQISVAVMGLSQASNLPTQVSANLPTTIVEVAFGSTPASITNPVMYNGWTDVTARSIGSAGSPVISGMRGRSYELSEPEAGVCTVGLNNWDGAFNPANTASPYYPNVVLNTPVRISCFWNGRRYGLFYGYVSKWPQEWPDLPQFGLSRMQCVDAVSVASAVTMPSALQGEILVDNPYACFPFDEQYSTTQQAPGSEQTFAIGGIQVPIDANGLNAANSSRTNQRPGTYMNGNPVGTTANPVSTGLTLGLLGDSGTGMGCTSYSSGPSNVFRGPGVLYTDPNAPHVTATSQVSVEFVFTVPTWTPDTVGGMFLFNAVPYPESTNGNYGAFSTNQSIQVYITYNVAIANAYALTVQCGQLGTGALTPLNSGSPVNITSLMGQPIHLVVRVAAGSCDFWVNGGNSGSASAFVSGSPQQLPISAWSFGQAHVPFQVQTDNWNYAMQYGTIYNYGLTPARIYNHYQAAISGFTGDLPNQRFGRLLAWTGINLQPGAWPQSSAYQVSLGAAYDVGGSSLSSSLNTVSTTDGGLWYANAVGNLMYACRRSLFDMPSSVTFGDSNTSGAEVPYLGNLGIDYDNAYLTNVVSTQQVNGPQTLSTAVANNQASEVQYFQRGPQQDTVESASVEDAYDRTNWLLNKYDQPSMRVRTMTVDAASNPSVFSKLLPIDIGSTATVNRRPMGATGTYSLPVSIQQIGFDIGPSVFQFKYTGTPYTKDNEVLVADLSGYNTLGSSVLAW